MRTGHSSGAARRAGALLLAVLVCLLCVVGSPADGDEAVAAGAGGLVNSGFESQGTGGYVYTPSGSGWVFSGHAGVQRNGSAFSGSTMAPEGVQSSFLQGAGSVGSMSQSVVLGAGSYAVGFQAARRWGSVQPVRVSVDGAAIGTYTPSDSVFSQVVTASFVVSGGAHVIGFSATDPSGDRTTFIDAVTISGAPTPTTAPTPTASPSSAPIPAPSGSVADIDLSGYRLTFADEFDALDVTARTPKSGARWYAFPPYGPAGNYSASAWSIDALTVADGSLVNKAYRSGGLWYSGNISSVDETGAGFSQRFGYFEARMKMPDSGTGAWPAFWLASTTGIPAVSPTRVRNEEVDVVEWYGSTNSAGNASPLIQQASHNYEPDGTQNPAGAEYLYAPQTRMPNGALPWTGYHVYGVKVAPTRITWFVDGVQTNQIATPTAYLTGGLYLMLDHGLGGGYPLTGVVDGSALLVDWVRVYSLPG